MNFPAQFYNHLKENNYTEILGGTNRETFLEIWIVQVNRAVYARSWGKSERSWYTAFLETGVGKFKFGDYVIEVRGEKVDKNSEIHQKINEAYQNRYTEEENIFYAEGISQPDYFDYTMQFFYIDK